MTMRTALMVMAVCAGLAALTPAVQAQDTESLQCPLPGGSATGTSGAIWAFA